MATVKITVLKRTSNQDLADEFCEANVTVPCPNSTEGRNSSWSMVGSRGTFAVGLGMTFIKPA